MSELNSDSVEGRMLEVEQAAMNTEAHARLAEIRSKLGITSGAPAAAPGVGAGEAQAEGEPNPT
jgi:hypothetical protein